MARLGIKRANGDIEYAELTTDKSLVGSHYLTVEKYGTPYYAKLGDSVSTHLCVEGSDGRKRYVQKEVKFVWKYVVDDSHPIDGFVIPRTGRYKITRNIFKLILRGHREEHSIDTTEVNLTQGDRPYNNEIRGIGLYAKSQGRYEEDGYPSPMTTEITLKSIEYIGEA